MDSCLDGSGRIRIATAGSGRGRKTVSRPALRLEDARSIPLRDLSTVARAVRMRPLRLLVIIEARSMTGPAKNLLEFARLSRTSGIETVIATFLRAETSNPFLETAVRQSIGVHTVIEHGRFDHLVLQSLNTL